MEGTFFGIPIDDWIVLCGIGIAVALAIWSLMLPEKGELQYLTDQPFTAAKGNLGKERFMVVHDEDGWRLGLQHPGMMIFSKEILTTEQLHNLASHEYNWRRAKYISREKRFVSKTVEN